jgi:hypothetical protein
MHEAGALGMEVEEKLLQRSGNGKSATKERGRGRLETLEAKRTQRRTNKPTKESENCR